MERWNEGKTAFSYVTRLKKDNGGRAAERPRGENISQQELKFLHRSKKRSIISVLLSQKDTYLQPRSAYEDKE